MNKKAQLRMIGGNVTTRKRTPKRTDREFDPIRKKRERKKSRGSKTNVDRSNLQVDETGALVGPGHLRPSRATGELRPAEETTPEQQSIIQLETGEERTQRTPEEEQRLRETGITTVGEAVTRPMTQAEQIAHNQAIADFHLNQNDVIRLGAEENASQGRSFQEQIQASFDLPLGHPASLRTTIALGSILAVGLGALALAPVLLSTITKNVGIVGRIYGRIITSGGKTLYVANPKTISLTSTFLTKLASGVGTAIKNPVFVGGALLSIIGSYPFAGFIKEESLQTLGFGINSAIQSGDVAGGERALREMEEILNPKLWERIIQKVPFVNVIKNLKDFYSSARVKMSIDTQIINDMKIQQKTGETEAEKWMRIDKEREDREDARRKESEEYYAQVEENQRRARKEQRKEDERYWKRVFAEKAIREAEERESEEAYWNAVRQENDRLRTQRTQAEASITYDSGRSNLNFGLL